MSHFFNPQSIRRLFPRDFLFACLLSIALLWPSASFSAAVSFTATVDGEQKSANLNAREVQGVSYLSLPALTRQLGGIYRVTPVRIAVDIAGANAAVGLNDTRVEGQKGSFSLQYPVILQENDVLIAVSDIPSFFSQGLQVTLQGSGAIAVASEPPPPTPDLAPGSSSPADTRIEVRDLTVTEPADEQLLNQMPTLESENRPFLDEGESIPDRPATQGPLRVIILDPGHGGNDSGLSGAGGLMEKNLSLALALRVRDRLKQLSGQTVVLTREEDRDMSCKERSILANQQKGDLLVSLHAGVSYSPAARGIEAFCAAPRTDDSHVRKSYLAPSHRCAENILSEISAQTGAPSRGVREMPLRILRETAMPGVLLEIGCLTNSEDAAALSSEEYQAKLAEGIAQGIVKAGEGGKAP